MVDKRIIDDNFIERTEKFLEDFMIDMYPKKDHYIARKYFRELFQKLVPKYFCICDKDNGSENIQNE